MGLRLKSGLNKTAVYQMLVDHNTSDVKLPLVRKCHFRSYRNSYWLKFDFEDDCYEIYFCSWCGEARFNLYKREYNESEDCYHETRIIFCCVPFEYLLDHEMLREVS